MNRTHWPTALGSLFKVATSPGGKVNPLEIGDLDEDTDSHGQEAVEDSSTLTAGSTSTTEKATARPKKEYRVYPRDPEADPPHNGVQRFARRMRAVWQWQTSPQGIFALKYSLVSIALWIPAICPSSAFFTYTHVRSDPFSGSADMS